MNILLINPPAPDRNEYIREGRCMQLKSSWAALWMPLTLAYSASYLRSNGHNTNIIDCIAEGFSLDDLTKKTLDHRPELVVLNTAFPTIKTDLYVAGRLKQTIAGLRIAAIGLCGTILGDRLLKETSDIDYVISGEPEWVLKYLAEAIEKQLPLRDIRGLIFRDEFGTVVSPSQILSQNNPDDLPFPARDLLDNERYRLPLTGKKFTLISIGRGCPHRCVYCTSQLYYGRTFRKRNISSIIDEIEECINLHDITNFLFWGESFTLDQAYGEAICREIVRRDLKITWSTTSRVDTLNEKLLLAMKQAGCAMLGLGIESANQQLLDNAMKGTSVKELQEAISIVKRSGIRAMGHFIFGLPGETKETAEKTIRFALTSGLDYAQFYCAVPYPGTELGELAQKKGWIQTDDYSQYDLSISVMKNEVLSPDDIKRLRDRAYRKFYLRPCMLLQALKEMSNFAAFFRSLNFLRWIKTGKGRLQ